jgi:hypothetical protein
MRRAEAGHKSWPPEGKIDGRAGYAPHKKETGTR